MAASPSATAPPLANVHRVAILEGFFADVVHPEVSGSVRAVADILSRAGAEIVTIDHSGIEDARHTWNVICCFEFARAYEHIRDRRHLIDPRVVAWLERGDRVTAEELEAATERREGIRQWFMDPLHRADALLIPTTPYPAPRADQAQMELEPGRVIDLDAVGPGFITSSVNLAGLPALNLPAGRSSDALPIGVSLVAGPGNEGVLFEVARRWTEASGYQPERPSLPAPSA
jgi:Asp-tRNA(Asn)/Glu-tRNA(Gln) amidotransferase A subunit family amidase